METLNKTIITKEEVVLCPICIQSVLDTDKEFYVMDMVPHSMHGYDAGPLR